jgi:hypothetical protein
VILQVRFLSRVFSLRLEVAHKRLGLPLEPPEPVEPVKPPEFTGKEQKLIHGKHKLAARERDSLGPGEFAMQNQSSNALWGGRPGLGRRS